MDSEETVRIKWYRTALSREELAALNQRSDIKGLAQSLGFLGLMTGTGALVLVAGFTGHWWYVPLFLFVHGMVTSFMINAVHELCHQSVFKSKWLNGLFVRIFGFVGWIDWMAFKASHDRHHRYTLHPPADGEVVLPLPEVCRKVFLREAVFTPGTIRRLFRATWNGAHCTWPDAWTQSLFPASQAEARRAVMRWNRSVLIGHAIILVASLVALALTGQWAWLLVPLVVSFGRIWGRWLFWACNSTQHVGMTGNVPDFRLCCRSIRLPWPISFLYWHMQYHIEHHMYAAVPCYNLRKLNRAIAYDLPAPKGLVGAWREIAAVRKRQATDPAFGLVPELPDTAKPYLFNLREAVEP